MLLDFQAPRLLGVICVHFLTVHEFFLLAEVGARSFDKTDFKSSSWKESKKSF